MNCGRGTPSCSATRPHEEQGLARQAHRMAAAGVGGRGLTERARQRAEELANDADLRMSPPKAGPVRTDTAARPRPRPCGSRRRTSAAPGTVLSREYKGRVEQVRVLEHGFEHEGEVHRSLSAVAKHITGTHTNGFLFFKLRPEARR